MRRILPTFSTRADVIGVATTAALTLAFIFGLVAPMTLFERHERAGAERGVRSQQQANTIAAGIRSLDAEIENTKARLAAMPLQIRPASALNEKLAKCIALAAECGLTVDELKPADGVRGARFIAVPITMSGRGGYANVTRFFSRLHAQLPDVAAGAFELSAAVDDRPSTGRYRMEMRWLALPDADSQPVTVTAVVP